VVKPVEPKKEQVSLSKLYLFEKNPRHAPLETEPALIAQLYKKDKVLKLAQHIAANGLNPLERIAVFPHPRVAGAYTVAEGNRRLCSLKLLHDPRKAPTPGARRAFEGLKESGLPLPPKFDVIVFPDYESASVWMAVKHNGEQGGLGTVRWGATEKSRFDAMGASRAVNPNAQALALLDHAEEAGLISAEERASIAITTVTRYLSSPLVRDALGLVNNYDLTIGVDPGEFNRVVKKFLSDALPPADEAVSPRLTSRSDKEQRQDYARELRESTYAPTTRLPAPVKADAGSGGAKADEQPKPGTPGGKPGGRTPPHPDKRPKVVPPDFKLPLKDKLLRRIYQELRSIDPDAFTFSAAFLLRSFVEQLAHLYANKHGLGSAGELHSILDRCVTHMEANGAGPKETKALRVMSSSKDSKLSIHTLGAAVHGSMIPTAVELKRLWDSIEKGLSRMIDTLG